MKLQEYIDKLQAIGAEHGFGLEVEAYNTYRGRYVARDPGVAYRKVLAGRERKAEFYSAGYQKPEQQGDKVVRID